MSLRLFSAAGERNEPAFIDGADALQTTPQIARDALSPGLVAIGRIRNFHNTPAAALSRTIATELPRQLWQAEKQFFAQRLP